MKDIKEHAKIGKHLLLGCIEVVGAKTDEIKKMRNFLFLLKSRSLVAIPPRMTQEQLLAAWFPCPETSQQIVAVQLRDSLCKARRCHNRAHQAC